MLICAAAAPRPKGIGKKWQLKYKTYIHIIFSIYPRITHAHTYACTQKKKGKDGHRRRHLDQGTLCQKNVSLLRFAHRCRHHTTVVVVVAVVVCCIQTMKTSAKRCAGPPPNVLRDFSNKALFLQQSHSCTRQLNW